MNAYAKDLPALIEDYRYQFESAKHENPHNVRDAAHAFYECVTANAAALKFADGSYLTVEAIINAM